MSNRFTHSSKTGKPCSAKTFSSVCAVIVLLKYLLSGISVEGLFTVAEFEATGASMLLGVFFITYVKRESDKTNKEVE